MMKDEILFSWDAPEYTHYNRSVDWYWGLGLIALSIAVVSIFLKNVLFAILVIISAGGIALFSIRKPRDINYSLSEKNLFIGNEKIPLSSLDSFSIEEQGGDTKIIFVSKSVLATHIIIPLVGYTTESIHDFLSNKLEEGDHGEPFISRIGNMLGI